MIEKVKNLKLKNSIRTLLKPSEDIFDFKEEKVKDFNWYIPTLEDFSKYGEIIKGKKEFQKCMKIMAEDQTIKGIIGNLIGTKVERIRVISKEDIILSFIKQYYLYNRKFNEIDFELDYKKLEELFYSNKLKFIEVGYIYNFHSKIPEIKLDVGLKIKQNNFPLPKLFHPNGFSIIPIHAHFQIEREFEMEKIIGEYNSNIDEIEKTYEIFISTIKALKILKSSGVFWDGEIFRQRDPFKIYKGMGSTKYGVSRNSFFGKVCEIQKSEIIKLARIFKSIYKEPKGRFRVAQDRLNFGIERKNPEDKLIDYMVGLEALYLPDIERELSFRLSIRIAKTLTKKSEAEKTFNFIKNMYDLRSKVIHGGEYKIDLEDINKLEKILRQSIMLGIDDKNILSEKKFKEILFK